MSSIITGVVPGEFVSQVISLNLSHHRKMRVWLGKLPPLNYPVAETLERTLYAKYSSLTNRRYAAVDMFIPKGGRAIYGLLGAEFKPERSPEIVARVAVSGTIERPIDWLLASRCDRTSIGLPSDYANSVLEGALATLDILGSGILHFACAAHGEVGSSPKIFRQLASTVVKLLASDIQSVLESEISAVFEVS